MKKIIIALVAISLSQFAFAGKNDWNLKVYNYLNKTPVSISFHDTCIGKSVYPSDHETFNSKTYASFCFPTKDNLYCEAKVHSGINCGGNAIASFLIDRKGGILTAHSLAKNISVGQIGRYAITLRFHK